MLFFSVIFLSLSHSRLTPTQNPQLSARFHAFSRTRTWQIQSLSDFLHPHLLSKVPKGIKVSKVFFPLLSPIAPNAPDPQTPAPSPHHYITTLHTLQKDPNHSPPNPQKDPTQNPSNTITHYGASGCSSFVCSIIFLHLYSGVGLAFTTVRNVCKIATNLCN